MTPKEGQKHTDLLPYQHLSFGDVLEITTKGMWGHDAYTKPYTFSGASGHYPNTVYRFTQIGDGSIPATHFADTQLKATECYEGFENVSCKIKSVTRKADCHEELAVGSVCKTCGGFGQLDDAECGDIYANVWDCPDCKNTGGVGLAGMIARYLKRESMGHIEVDAEVLANRFLARATNHQESGEKK